MDENALLYFLRDGTPSTEAEVYAKGGFQCNRQDALARGLITDQPEEKAVAAPPETKAIRKAPKTK